MGKEKAALIWTRGRDMVAIKTFSGEWPSHGTRRFHCECHIAQYTIFRRSGARGRATSLARSATSSRVSRFRPNAYRSTRRIRPSSAAWRAGRASRMPMTDVLIGACSPRRRRCRKTSMRHRSGRARSARRMMLIVMLIMRLMLALIVTLMALKMALKNQKKTQMA